jgi:hypothetical protein
VTKVRKQTTKDRFNRLGCRDRTVEEEECICHGIVESRTDDGITFEAECRVTLHLEDGRKIDKVFSLVYDETDVEEGGV